MASEINSEPRNPAIKVDFSQVTLSMARSAGHAANRVASELADPPEPMDDEDNNNAPK